MKFIRFDWIRAYGFDLVISTLMIGINYYLSKYVGNPLSDNANYMYVWEVPNVEHPLLPSSLPWPLYLMR